MSRRPLEGSLVAGVMLFAAAPSLSYDRQPFETVKGWEIERAVGDASAHVCLMSHTYKDKDDKNAVNGIIFALSETGTVLTLVYENWTWDKQESVRVPFFLDKVRYDAKSRWTGDGQSLTGTFPTSIVPSLMAAQTIVLKFDNGLADFQIGGFAEGYESLRRCDATKVGAAAAAAPAAPAPVAPPAVPAVAPAGRYQITTIGAGADFAGCMAVNEPAGLAMVAVGQSVGLIANSTKFPFQKGSAVKGAWTVDGAGAIGFASKVDTDHTVSIDVPNTTEAVTRLTTGKSLVIKANDVEVAFALGPMKQAFTDLATCMETKKAP